MWLFKMSISVNVDVQKAQLQSCNPIINKWVVVNCYQYLMLLSSLQPPKGNVWYWWSEWVVSTGWSTYTAQALHLSEAILVVSVLLSQFQAQHFPVVGSYTQEWISLSSPCALLYEMVTVTPSLRGCYGGDFVGIVPHGTLSTSQLCRDRLYDSPPFNLLVKYFKKKGGGGMLRNNRKMSTFFSLWTFYSVTSLFLF